MLLTLYIVPLMNSLSYDRYAVRPSCLALIMAGMSFFRRSCMTGGNCSLHRIREGSEDDDWLSTSRNFCLINCLSGKWLNIATIGRFLEASYLPMRWARSILMVSDGFTIFRVSRKKFRRVCEQFSERLSSTVKHSGKPKNRRLFRIDLDFRSVISSWTELAEANSFSILINGLVRT